MTCGNDGRANVRPRLVKANGDISVICLVVIEAVRHYRIAIGVLHSTLAGLSSAPTQLGRTRAAFLVT
jgi:hypothetical protein